MEFINRLRKIITTREISANEAETVRGYALLLKTMKPALIKMQQGQELTEREKKEHEENKKKVQAYVTIFKHNYNYSKTDVRNLNATLIEKGLV